MGIKKHTSETDAAIRVVRRWLTEAGFHEENGQGDASYEIDKRVVQDSVTEDRYVTVTFEVSGLSVEQELARMVKEGK